MLRFERHPPYSEELMSSRETHRSAQLESSELKAKITLVAQRCTLKYGGDGWGSTKIRENVLEEIG